MKIFNESAYINLSDAAKNYQVTMQRTNSKHMAGIHESSGNDIIRLRDAIGAEGVTGAGTFETAMLNALDKVSGAQKQASFMAREAIINPENVDIHDVTIAQAEANMSLNITRNILSRLVQGWRDLINVR